MREGKERESQRQKETDRQAGRHRQSNSQTGFRGDIRVPVSPLSRPR